MRRSWQIWIAFVACLIAVVTAAGWLSYKVVQADRAEALTQRQATLEENARLALWRMEAAMTALVTQEGARPPFMYSAFYPADPTVAVPKAKAAAPAEAPSPLLVNRPPRTLLHFQFDPQGNFSSPQVPEGRFRDLAVPGFLSSQQLADNASQLQQLEKSIDPPLLMAELPAVEPVNVGYGPFAGNAAIEREGIGRFGLNSAMQSTAVNPFDAPTDDIATPPQTAPLPQQPAQMPRQAAPLANQEAQAVQQSQRGQVELQARQRFNLQSNRMAPAFGGNSGLWRGEGATDTQMSIMTPQWLDGRLVLLRRVVQNGHTSVQGCLLDWPGIQEDLRGEITDLLSQADVRPITGADETTGVRRLASLPVQLIPGPLPDVAVAGLSSLRLSLLLTWGAILVAVAAAAALLQGVIALGERRAAFVSAVTHELRTPLTTFRMYAEMLSEGMVSDEADRRHYLRTLRVEADRLTHLVANVLAYARLERGRPGGRMTAVSVRQILDVASERLAERAAGAELNLTIDAAPDVLQITVVTDTAAVEQILFNLVDNACKYAASAEDRRLSLSVVAEPRHIAMRVCDHGPGVSPAQRRWLFQPFRKSAREAADTAPGVGLGLALCRRLARDLGGDLRHEPSDDGACFLLTLPAPC